MQVSKRMKVLVISAAAVFGTLAAAVPASASTYYYTLKYSPTWWGGRTCYYQRVTQTRTTPAPTPSKPAPAPSKPAPSQPTTPARPAPAPATAGLTASEQQMVNLVNAERAKAGLPALQVDMQLVKVARVKSQDMITHNYFSHQSPTYGSPFDMMRSYGISYRTAGENIAGNGSVQAAHTALMNSSGHRANILGSGYTKIGIGIVNGGPYGMMFSQEFIG